jgi:hypothetical protein
MLDLIELFHQEEEYFCLQSEGLSHVCQGCNVKYIYEAHHKKNYGMLTMWYMMEKFCGLKSAFKN